MSETKSPKLAKLRWGGAFEQIIQVTKLMSTCRGITWTQTVAAFNKPSEF